MTHSHVGKLVSVKDQMLDILGVMNHIQFLSHRLLCLLEQTFKHIKTTQLWAGQSGRGWGWLPCRLSWAAPHLTVPVESWKGLQPESTDAKSPTGSPTTQFLPNSQAQPLQQGQFLEKLPMLVKGSQRHKPNKV